MDVKKLGYKALFRASAGVLQDLAANPKRLGAQLGLLASAISFRFI